MVQERVQAFILSSLLAQHSNNLVYLKQCMCLSWAEVGVGAGQQERLGFFFVLFFSYKRPDGEYFRLCSQGPHVVLCHHSTKTAIGNM